MTAKGKVTPALPVTPTKRKSPTKAAIKAGKGKGRDRAEEGDVVAISDNRLSVSEQAFLVPPAHDVIDSESEWTEHKSKKHHRHRRSSKESKGRSSKDKGKNAKKEKRHHAHHGKKRKHPLPALKQSFCQRLSASEGDTLPASEESVLQQLGASTTRASQDTTLADTESSASHSPGTPTTQTPVSSRKSEDTRPDPVPANDSAGSTGFPDPVPANDSAGSTGLKPVEPAEPDAQSLGGLDDQVPFGGNGSETPADAGKSAEAEPPAERQAPVESPGKRRRKDESPGVEAPAAGKPPAVVPPGDGYQIPEGLKQLVLKAEGSAEVPITERNRLYRAMGRVFEAVQNGRTGFPGALKITPAMVARYDEAKKARSPGALFHFLQEWVQDTSG